MTVLAVTVGGVDRTGMLVPGSLHAPDRVSQRSEASFTLRLPAGGAWHPQPFDPVLIKLDGGLAFEGFVWDEDEERVVPLPGSMPMLAPIRCVDLHLLADRRIVAETYNSKTAGYIFTDLVKRYLAADGISTPDVNVALAKTVTVSPNAFSSANLWFTTDGTVDTNQYTDLGNSTDSAPVYVQIDLGRACLIDTVKVWHYFLDGRTYYSTKTAVSADGVTWQTVFDSAVSGTYAETAAGRTTKFNPVVARYVRDYSLGSTANIANHWVEVQAYGGTVQAGPTLTRVVFNYQSLSKCFDELAQVAGFEWHIVAGRVANFFDRTTNVAPWVINATAPLKSLRVRRHREQYRNRQYLRAGMGTSDPRTDSYKGNGQNKTFTCVYPLASKPSQITVNGVAVAANLIGIRGLDQGKQWYWQKNDPVVSQDDASTPISGTDTLAITYQGLFPIVIQSDLSSEINSRATAEGGTGIYEEVEQNANLDDQIAAREFADGKLKQFARLNQEIIFTTTAPGLRAGQLLTVTLPEHGITGTYLITECSLSDGGLGEYGVFMYTVRAVDGSSVGDWINFFKHLSEAGKQYAIRENEVMVRLKSATDGIGITVSMAAVYRAAPVAAVGTATVGYSEVG